MHDELAQKIERATRSKQPRFKRTADEAARMIINLAMRADKELPVYSSDTRYRDTALLNLVRSEPLLAGVVSSAVSRDKNRGWLLTGPARQVSSYSRKLHGAHDGEGWRQFVSMNALSWYATNFGYASEIGFRYVDGPAETLWHIDPARCRLTGINNPSMYYYPNTGKVPLKRNEFIHGNSLPSVEEKMNRAGFCAVERALEFSRLMIGINRHQLEKLGVAPAKGFLLGKGITRDEYDQAVQQANEDAQNRNLNYYKGVLAFFTRNVDAAIELIGLSQLPDNFELNQFIDVVMQAYALAFGYPVGEFWSIHSGSFGRTGEMKEQQQQATAKGELDFALSFQEQLQTYFLPSTVNFQFDQRNDRGDLVRAEANFRAWQIIKEAYEAGLKEGQSLIDRDEARRLMVELGILPAEMTSEEEDTTASDLKEIRGRMLSQPEIVEAIQAMPDEPIVMYKYAPEEFKTPSPNKIKKISKNAMSVLGQYYFPPGDVQLLWDSGLEATKQRIY
jgi:hypothetical protein